MKLADYIDKKFMGNQAAFARSIDVKPQQITQWLNKEFIVLNGIIYSPRRELILKTGEVK